MPTVGIWGGNRRGTPAATLRPRRGRCTKRWGVLNSNVGMSIRPKDSRLLTDHDVDCTFFRCCGDEDLTFLRCAHCGHIWVECYECSTWYVDLRDLGLRQSSLSSDLGPQPCCPACATPFAHATYLMPEHVDGYLPTAEQVIEAGFQRFLAPHLRPGPLPS